MEIVARERYMLLRTTRIFADLVIMTDAIRLAVHLGRKVNSSVFFKIGDGGRHVTHVTRLASEADLRTVLPFLKEAYEHSLTPVVGSR